MENIKKLVPVLLFSIVCLCLSTTVAYAQQTSGELYEKALYTEEVKGELQNAIDLYQQVLENNPENKQVAAKALLHQGMCYEKLGLKQAYKTYQDIINNYPEQQDEVTAAKERVNYLEAFAANLNKKAEQLLKEGNELFSRWEYESAIEEYKNAIKLDPNSLLALNAQYCIGQSWFRAGKYDEALVTFKKLIEENPESNIAPVTELMVAQVQYAMEHTENPGIAKRFSDGNTIVDPETGITYTKIKTFTGKSDVITLPGSLKLSPNGKYLLCENMVVPMDGTAPFELIEYNSTGIQAHRGTWSPDGTQAAFYSGDALCVVPVSPETGHTTGPFKKINNVELKYQSGPGWSPDGKKLTYYGPGGDLWTIDAEGNNLKQITNSDVREVGPAWSPDGKTIAYGIGQGLGLYSVKEDSFNEFADVGFRCFPAWSPDGKWLTLNWQKLHFYNLNKKSKFDFSPPEEAGNFFSWSPEGEKMLFFRTSYHYDSGLKIASSAGGPSFEPVPLLTNWWTAIWSDNSKLMAVQGEDEKGDIAFRIVPLTGGKSFLINLDNLIDGKPFPSNISSDLKKLLFTVDRDDGKDDVFIVPVSAEDARTTGPAVKIFDGVHGEGPTPISPDGKKVALIHEGNIWIAFTNGDDPIQITNTVEKEGYIRWTPDGKALLFGTPSGWGLLKNPETEGKVIQLLDEGHEIECPHWNISFSPDNTRFAILTNEKIKIISLNGSTSNQVLSFKSLELVECFSLTWSPDGKNLAFIGKKESDDLVSFPEGKYQIFYIPVNGGQPIRIAQDDDDYKWGLSWSHDGKWIAYGPEKPVKVRPESTIWEADFEEVKEKLLQLE